MDLRSSDPLDIDHARINIFESMAWVAKSGGKSRLEQVIEMAQLVFGNAKLSPTDYYQYQLYDDSLHSKTEKRKFIGNNQYWTTTLRVSDWRWCALTDDKLVTATILKSNHIAFPDIRAVYHRQRSFPGAAALNTPDALRDYLTHSAVYPLFGKPVSGFESQGAVLLQRYEKASGELVLHNDVRVPIGEFVDAVEQLVYQPLPRFHRFRTQLGYLFQEVIPQHPEIVAAAGPIVASIRLYVIIDDSEPRIMAVVWKIPAPGSFADNFVHQGNMLAAVDIATGSVTRVIRGAGINLEETDHNPYARQKLIGFRLPHFEKLKKVVLQGANLIPGIRVQGWDVAIGPDGPIVIEINNGSSYTVPQLATGRGFLSPEFRRFLERAEAENETYPWKDFFQQQQHGHRYGRSKGVLKLIKQKFFPARPRQ